MSSWAQWFQIASSAASASATRKEGKDARLNAELLRAQAREEQIAASRDEEAHRRASRIAIGRQVAATGESGIGYGGSAGLLIEQSAVLSELDALNIRYGGELRAKGLLAESAGMRRRAKSTGLLAGAQLLTGFSSAYTRNKLTG